MYCPKCSQQQISEEMRFCSRCGFPLEGVKDLIVTGGVLEKRENNPLTKRDDKLFCGVRKSIAIMLGAIPMLLVVGAITAIDEDFVVLVALPFICFLIGFFFLLYVTVKEMNRRKVEAAAVALAQQNASSQNAQLPPQRVIPVDNFTQRINTAEMVHPASVTENTTRLLDEEPATQR